MTVKRSLVIAAIAIVGMGSLGFAAMVAALVRDTGLSGLFDDADIILTLPISFAIGCIVGVLSLPFVIFGLWKAKLNWAVPFVYAPSLLIVMSFIWIANRGMWYPLNSACIALASVCILSVMARWFCPRKTMLDPTLCPACAYPIGSSEVCTECGRPVQRPAHC